MASSSNSKKDFYAGLATASAVLLAFSFNVSTTEPTPIASSKMLAAPPRISWLRYLLGEQKIPVRPAAALPAPADSSALVFGGYSSALLAPFDNTMADLTIDVRFVLLLIVLGAVVMALYNRRSSDNVETPTKTETPRKCTTSRNTPATDRQSRVAGRALEALQQELVTVRQERLDLRLQLEAQAQQIAKLVEMQAAKIDTTTNHFAALEQLRAMSKEQFAVEYLNIASAEQLMGLKEVGTVRAKAIVEKRKISPFKKPEDLASVNEFGGQGLRKKQVLASIYALKP